MQISWKGLYLLLGMINLYAVYSNTPIDTSIVSKQKRYGQSILNVCFNHQDIHIVLDSSILQMYCDTLPQVKFWEKVLELSPDSAILNFAHNRYCIQTIGSRWWITQSDDFKFCYKDSIRRCYQLPDTARILFTTGKGHYYQWDTVFYLIDKAIDIFKQNDVDPWYAQSILLIESPRGNLRSPAGARGYFQLMKNVARRFGLKVNRYVDERLNFNRSAYAAAMLIKNICIPETKKILDTLHINYSENDLWFKLLCMHIYHAGSYNVKMAIVNGNCKTAGMDLIYCLWQTKTGAFQSASQNYSQLILTAYIRAYKKLNLLHCIRPSLSNWPSVYQKE